HRKTARGNLKADTSQRGHLECSRPICLGNLAQPHDCWGIRGHRRCHQYRCSCHVTYSMMWVVVPSSTRKSHSMVLLGTTSILSAMKRGTGAPDGGGARPTLRRN